MVESIIVVGSIQGGGEPLGEVVRLLLVVVAHKMRLSRAMSMCCNNNFPFYVDEDFIYSTSQLSILMHIEAM